MKALIQSLAAGILLLPLTGCYNLVMLNVGSATHEASAVGPPLAPEVQCAALAKDAGRAKEKRK